MKELLGDLILFRNHQEVENLLKVGVDPNLHLENGKPGAEWASFSDDFQMMEIFWRAGAKPTTEFVEKIFRRFANGETYDDMVQPKEDLSDYPDLTETFSVKKLQFKQGTITMEDENFYEIEIEVEKFVLEGNIVDTFLCLSGIALPHGLECYIGKSMNFPLNPDEGYIDGSIYMMHVHNPVDVREISFVKLEKGYLTAEIAAEFLFEYEDTNYKNERTKILVDLIVSE